MIRRLLKLYPSNMRRSTAVCYSGEASEAPRSVLDQLPVPNVGEGSFPVAQRSWGPVTSSWLTARGSITGDVQRSLPEGGRW